MAKRDKKDVKNNKDKKNFIKSFKAELKKVTWPTPKQLFNSTVAVLAIVFVTAVIVFFLDFSFESINKYGIDKIKESVSNSSLNETSSENEISDGDNEILEEDTVISNETVDEENIENESAE